MEQPDQNHINEFLTEHQATCKVLRNLVDEKSLVIQKLEAEVKTIYETIASKERDIAVLTAELNRFKKPARMEKIVNQMLDMGYVLAVFTVLIFGIKGFSYINKL